FAAFLCVILASLAFVAQDALAARAGALNNVKGYTVPTRATQAAVVTGTGSIHDRPDMMILGARKCKYVQQTMNKLSPVTGISYSL
uniref:Uncharacterized protein n=1 Tax=Triticum urartu TaxID=4572 RepID=A0A8R7PH44_TRIUA